MDPLEIVDSDPSASDADEERAPPIARVDDHRRGPPDPALRLALSSDEFVSANASRPTGPNASIHLALPPQRQTLEPPEPENPTFSMSKSATGVSPGANTSSSVAAPIRIETGERPRGIRSEGQTENAPAPLFSGGSSPLRTRDANFQVSTARSEQELEVGYRSAGLELALDSLRMPYSMDPLRAAAGAASVPRSSPSSDEDPFDALVADAVARSTRAAAELARTRLGLTQTLSLSNTAARPSASAPIASAPPAPLSSAGVLSASSSPGKVTGAPAPASGSGIGSALSNTKSVGEHLVGAGSGIEPEPGGDRERPALKAALKLHFDENVTSSSEVGIYNIQYLCLKSSTSYSYSTVKHLSLEKAAPLVSSILFDDILRYLLCTQHSSIILSVRSPRRHLSVSILNRRRAEYESVARRRWNRRRLDVPLAHQSDYN